MEQTLEIQEFKIGGMSCAACSAAVERVVKRLKFVESATVNLSTERLRVRGESIDLDAVIRAVTKAGFTASLLKDRKAQESEDRAEKARALRRRKRELVISAIFGGTLFLISMLGMFVNYPFLTTTAGCVIFTVLEIALLVPVLICGRGFYIRGFRALWKLHPNMDSLVALGTLASITYSVLSFIRVIKGDCSAVKDMYWDSAAVIITLVMLGKYFEARSKDKTLDSVRALRALTPDKADILTVSGESRSVDVDSLMRGDTVLIKPGTRIPCDGIVLDGSGFVDESMITGESVPVYKEAGSALSAGTLNGTGFMRMRAESVGEETSVAEMIRLVEDAQGSKAPVSRLADKIAAVFVPAVAAIAIISMLMWLISGASASEALNVFVSVLVVACPCSLGLATPTAIMVGTGAAAEKGILIKSGEALENAHRLRIVCFDKTGTLTNGKPEVTDIIPEGITEDAFISIIASVERNSEHPLAKAVVRYAEKRNVSLRPCDDFEALPGEGVKATIEGNSVLCGKPELLTENGISVPKDLVDRIAGEGNTVLLLAVNGKYTGLAAVADTVRDDAAATVEKLHAKGIRTVLITGDHERTAQAIAKKTGISQYYARVLPKDKSEIVRDLKTETQTVGMAGDGINDAPALASADIAFSVASGTDVALATADIILLGNRLSSLADAISISEKTMRVIKQNLFWAFFYNCIGISFAAGLLRLFGGPFLSPMICALAMSFSSVTVVSNALRLKKLCRKI